MYDEVNTHSDALTIGLKQDGLPQAWKAKLPFEIQQSSYTIKTANNKQEFDQVLELRREVFHNEFANREITSQTDFESYDLDSDFLMIVEKGSVIATYRLIYSDFSKNFYSASEFDISSFMSTSSSTLELSRACVRKGKRAGIALHLLWRGIAEYMKRSGAKYLFGCSSVQSLDLEQIVHIYRFMEQEGVLSDEFDIQPLDDYHLVSMKGLRTSQIDSGSSVDMTLIPPLLLSYIKAGARVFGAPAVDLKFGCIDFFTVLDFEHLSQSYLKKYVQRQIQ